MALVISGRVVTDPYIDCTDREVIPAAGDVLLTVDQWQAGRDTLGGRSGRVGVKLRSDQAPELIAEDLAQLSLVALEFPAFRDGRAYSYARILRDRYGYSGELRAVGDVLLEQLHFMTRVGFDAFELNGEDPEGTYRTAMADFSVWYQPAADGRDTAMALRWNRQ